MHTQDAGGQQPVKFFKMFFFFLHKSMKNKPEMTWCFQNLQIKIKASCIDFKAHIL